MGVTTYWCGACGSPGGREARPGVSRFRALVGSGGAKVGAGGGRRAPAHEEAPWRSVRARSNREGEPDCTRKGGGRCHRGGINRCADRRSDRTAATWTMERLEDWHPGHGRVRGCQGRSEPVLRPTRYDLRRQRGPTAVRAPRAAAATDTVAVGDVGCLPCLLRFWPGGFVRARSRLVVHGEQDDEGLAELLQQGAVEPGERQDGQTD